MKKLIAVGIIGLLLTACSDATRTVPVLVWEERTISGNTPLAIPPDYRNPTLPEPKDTVLSDYKKNNYVGEVKSTPLPPPRPYDLGKKK